MYVCACVQGGGGRGGGGGGQPVSSQACPLVLISEKNLQGKCSMNAFSSELVKGTRGSLVTCLWSSIIPV